MNPWIAAARPKTLVAGLIPVALGSALAAERGHFHTGVFCAALGGAIAIQIGANYVNDAADFQKGADTEDRLGPPRMAAQGLLSPKALYLGAATAFLLALCFGLYLIAQAGLAILAIGLVSILFAVAYTAGPFPLAYLGLGDLFVLIFFGLVAVLGTYYSHALSLRRDAWYLAFATGFHGVSLIAVNNLRDIPTDEKAGKKTIAVRLGDKGSRIYYSILLMLPYFFWIPFAIRLPLKTAFLPYLSFPMAVKNMQLCFEITDRRRFNGLLGTTAALQLLFGALACMSLVAS
jgi:1,4-dihydroxy-2-naphthoate octaprenyltransferase